MGRQLVPHQLLGRESIAPNSLKCPEETRKYLTLLDTSVIGYSKRSGIGNTEEQFDRVLEAARAGILTTHRTGGDA